MLGKEGGNKQKILHFAEEVALKKYGKIDSLLIAHKGKLLFESYYLRGRVNIPHPQASTTKAYTSLAVGRAMQLGYLSQADLHKPLIGFIKQLDTRKLAKGAETITLHKAMTMRSGLGLTREEVRELEKNQPGLFQGWKQVQTYLERTPAVTAEAQSFDYKPFDPQLVMQVLESVVPTTAEKFIETELLTKLGIRNYRWQASASGQLQAPYGASMTSRNMLKWGLLIRNQGMWQGEQLIPTAYLEKVTHRIHHLTAEDTFFINDIVRNPGYGYYFWQADLQVGKKKYFSTSAQGGGGQYIIYIDELDLLVITTGHDRELRPLKFTAEKIIPAFL